MAATAEQIADLRRMAAVPLDKWPDYTDPVLKRFIEAHPQMDELGQAATYFDGYTVKVNPGWIPTYDLNAAAADIWEEKASKYAEGHYDFSADGSTFNRSQVVNQCKQQARTYRSQRGPKTIGLIAWPSRRPQSEEVEK